MKLLSLPEEERVRLKAGLVQRMLKLWMKLWRVFWRKGFWHWWYWSWALTNLGVSVGRDGGEGQNQTKTRTEARAENVLHIAEKVFAARTQGDGREERMELCTAWCGLKNEFGNMLRRALNTELKTLAFIMPRFKCTGRFFWIRK